MARTRRASRRGDIVSASELAEMAVCERRVLLSHLHGERRTRGQRIAMQRGLRAHDRFHREGLAANGSLGRHLWPVVARLARCFVGLWAWLAEVAAKVLDLRHQRAKRPGAEE